jgi:hypothetical protein
MPTAKCGPLPARRTSSENRCSVADECRFDPPASTTCDARHASAASNASLNRQRTGLPSGNHRGTIEPQGGALSVDAMTIVAPQQRRTAQSDMRRKASSPAFC